MTYHEWATLSAIALSPTVAVGITLWYQGRSQKYNAKHNLFVTLMAYRKSFPPTLEWANALNLIDVIYADHSKVVSLWHDVYSILTAPPPISWEEQRHKYLDLLSEMGKVLGYRALQQTDIDKFYSPQAHGNATQLSYEIQTEFLRVLKSTQSLFVLPKQDEPFVPRATDPLPSSSAAAAILELAKK